MAHTNGTLPFINKYSGSQKLFFCILLGILTYFVSSPGLQLLVRLMMSWVIFSLFMIISSWITFFKTDTKQIRAQAKVQDEYRIVVFSIVLIATLTGLIAVIILIMTKKENGDESAFKIPLAILGMLMSWLLIHTTFTLRYAHMFYGNNEQKPDTHAGGLEFPNDDEPDYLDFAYFSFNVGMTFQVSDVQVTSKRIRKMVLLHSLISFLFATIMIALTINLIS